MIKDKFLFVVTVPNSLIFYKGQIRFLFKKFDVEVTSSSGKNLEKVCKTEKVKGHVIEMKREISIFNDIISLIDLIAIIKRIKPKVVHGSTPKAGLLSMTAAWFNRVSTRIYYIHGLRYEGEKDLKRKLLVKMEQLSCFFATDIFVVSNGVKLQLIKDRITKKKINIIRNGSVNGIDANYFNARNPEVKDVRNDYKIFKNDFVFGFVGRLVKDKGINELVLAFKKINSIHKNTKLVLVGKFEDELDPLNIEIKNEILNNKNIIFSGFQNDIRPFLKIMKVFVFPSYREGFGVSLMEAAAMGVPSIASNITGCNEIIKHNYNGLLIEPKSMIEIERAMSRLLASPSLLDKMGKISRQFVIDKYEQSVLWKDTLEAYSDIVNKNNKLN